MQKNNKYKLRVIAGSLRGKIIQVPQTVNLRPTPERVRETLFNWLQNEIVGCQCLDLFAGSGMLAIEALSRGAASATLVEQDLHLYKHLKELQKKLLLNFTCVFGDALKILMDLSPVYNLIFLDPPFASTFLIDALKIIAKKYTTQKCLIYFETDQFIDFAALGYRCYKHSHAGYKQFGLLI